MDEGKTTAGAARERSEALQEVLAERILVLDGATGTWIQGQNLTAADFGGEAYEGCNEHLVLTRPDVVRKMHESYLEAGADMVETDTFGGTPLVLAECGLAEKAFEINAAAARIAREAAARFSTPDRPRFVAGSMGPTEFGISRKTGYKIFERYKDCGVAAFSNRSRRPYRQANRLPPQLEATIVRLKREYPNWGAPKIREKLMTQARGVRAPRCSMACGSAASGSPRNSETARISRANCTSNGCVVRRSLRASPLTR